MHTMRIGKLLKQLRIGAQSVQAPMSEGYGELKWVCPLCSYRRGDCLLASHGE